MSVREATLLLLLFLLLTASGTAHASTASTTSRTEYEPKGGEYVVFDVELRAADGERNDVVVTREADGTTVIRDAAGISAGSGCRPTPDPQVVRCERTSLGRLSSVVLGDGDDRLASEVSGGTVDAGTGDDLVQVDAKMVAGGAGADVLRAGTGTVVGGEGPDELTGAVVSYADRTESVTADLEGDADDGGAGEGDRIGATVRDLVGGAGDDRLVGNGGENVIDGGAGADALVGNEGADRLSGGPGLDALEGGGGDDRLGTGFVDERLEGLETLSGGPGRDALFGTAGRQRLDGGPGTDTIEGGGGDDDVPAADGELDLIGCSVPPAASGQATLDRLDLARGCAATTRTGPGAPRLLVLGQTDFDRDGLIRVGVGCSQDQRGGCPVEVRLRRGRRVLATRSTLVAAGTAKLIRPEVPRRYLRTTRTRPCAALRLTVELRTRTTTGRARRAEASYRYGSLALRCGNSFLLTLGPDAGW